MNNPLLFDCKGCANIGDIGKQWGNWLVTLKAVLTRSRLFSPAQGFSDPLKAVNHPAQAVNRTVHAC